jgi:hypothetical protein
VKIPSVLGITLTIGGSLLPWQQEGDFISYSTNGIRVSPVIEDNGGFVIILLSIVILMLLLRPFVPEVKSTVWSILVGAALVLDSALHVGSILVHRMGSGGVVGSPTIGIGLIMVCCGSILLLATARHSHLNQLL